MTKITDYPNDYVYPTSYHYDFDYYFEVSIGIHRI